MFGEKIYNSVRHKIMAFHVAVSSTVETKCTFMNKLNPNPNKWTTHLWGFSNTFPTFYPFF